MKLDLIDRKLFLTVTGFFFFFYLFTARGYLSTYDYYGRFLLTRNMVEEHSFRLPEGAVAVEGADGSIYSKYGPGESILFIPFYLAGKGISLWLDDYPEEMVEQFACSLLFQAATAVACGLLYLLGRCSGLSRRTSLLVTFLYGIASLAWPYSKFHNAQPLETLFILSAAWALFRYKADGNSRRLLLAGAFIAVAVLCRIPAIIFVIPAVTGILCFEPGVGRGKGRVRRMARDIGLLLIPLVPLFALLLLYNFTRFGSVSDFGYGRVEGFLVPLEREFRGNVVAGLFGFILSPGRGLLFFVPLLLLFPAGIRRMWRERRSESLFCLVAVFTYLLFYSHFTAWYGTEAWGPRYIVPVLPFLFLPLGWVFRDGMPGPGRVKRYAVIILIAISFLNQVPPVAVSPGRYFNRMRALSTRGIWVDPVLGVRHSELVLHWSNLVEVVGRMAAGEALTPGFDEEIIDIAENDPYDYRMHSLATGVLSFWFVYLYYLDFPLPIILLAFGFVLAMTILFARRIGKLSRRKTCPVP